MKATWDIPEEMLDNTDRFTNDFYKRFTLRKAPQPLRMNESVTKDYLFPTFYGDVTCAVAVFMCSYEKAAALIAEQLSPQIVPVRMTRGRALVAFSCYEYKNVMGVRPYNEIAIAIPVMVDPVLQRPCSAHDHRQIQPVRLLYRRHARHLEREHDQGPHDLGSAQGDPGHRHIP